MKLPPGARGGIELDRFGFCRFGFWRFEQGRLHYWRSGRRRRDRRPNLGGRSRNGRASGGWQIRIGSGQAMAQLNNQPVWAAQDRCAHVGLSGKIEHDTGHAGRSFRYADSLDERIVQIFGIQALAVEPGARIEDVIVNPLGVVETVAAVLEFSRDFNRNAGSSGGAPVPNRRDVVRRGVGSLGDSGNRDERHPYRAQSRNLGSHCHASGDPHHKSLLRYVSYRTIGRHNLLDMTRGMFISRRRGFHQL